MFSLTSMLAPLLTTLELKIWPEERKEKRFCFSKKKKVELGDFNQTLQWLQ